MVIDASRLDLPAGVETQDFRRSNDGPLEARFMFTINKRSRVALVVACAALLGGVFGLSRAAASNQRVQVASSVSDETTTSSMSGYMVAVG